MRPQFSNGGMVVVRHLVGQRQVARIEDARLAPEELQQAGGFLHDEA